MRRAAESVVAHVDHLVYAARDLAAGVETIERLLGLRATPGGAHPGRGTANALVALGPSAYLEIIGVDPDQPDPAAPRAFGIDGLCAPGLVTWAAKAKDLERVAADAARQGTRLGGVTAGSRRRRDGLLLAWRYTDPAVVVADGLVPFFIDWGTTPHPAEGAAGGATLVSLRAEHPDALRVRVLLAKLGLNLPVTAGPGPALIAEVASPKGTVEVR